MAAPKNRKQRRATAAEVLNPEDSFDASSMPLAHPSEDVRSKTKPAKTLYEVIAERQQELALKMQGKEKTVTASKPCRPPKASSPAETQFVTVDESGRISQIDDPSKSLFDSEEFKPPAGTKVDSKKESKDTATDDDEEEEEELIPPILDTLLLSVTLTILHLTLAYLAAHQYAQEIPIKALFRESAFVAFPVLTLLIHLAHGHIVPFGRDRGKQQQQPLSLFPITREKLTFSFFRKLLFPPSLKTCVFLPIAIYLGGNLIAITNEDPYYAVMKRAPAMGTIWMWCILEMSLGAATVGALGPLGWGILWKGYGIF